MGHLMFGRQLQRRASRGRSDNIAPGKRDDIGCQYRFVLCRLAAPYLRRARLLQHTKTPLQISLPRWDERCELSKDVVLWFKQWRNVF